MKYKDIPYTITRLTPVNAPKHWTVMYETVHKDHYITSFRRKKDKKFSAVVGLKGQKLVFVAASLEIAVEAAICAIEKAYPDSEDETAIYAKKKKYPDSEEEPIVSYLTEIDETDEQEDSKC